MPKNKRYTDNEALDAVGNKLKSAGGNIQVRYDAGLNQFEFLAPVGETIQQLALSGTTLQVVTNQTTRSVDLAALAGQDTRIVDLYLAGKQLNLDTQVGSFSVDLAPLVPAAAPVPVAVQSLSAPGGYLRARMTDGSEVEIDMSDFTNYLLGLAQQATQINRFERVGTTLELETNARGVQQVDLSDLAGPTLAADTLAALAGTSGTPSGTNKFVTSTDARVSLIKPGNAANSVAIVAGNNATITASGSAIIGGSGSMSISGNGNAAIIGGDNNQVKQYAGAIVGGGTNVIGDNGYFGGMVGGVLNTLNGQRSAMVGGEWTQNNGYASGTVGGAYNSLNSNYSVLLGGSNFSAPAINEMVFVPQLYLFKNGGGVSMVSPGGSRHVVSILDNGKLAVDGVEISGGTGGGGPIDDSNYGKLDQSNTWFQQSVFVNRRFGGGIANQTSIDANGISLDDFINGSTTWSIRRNGENLEFTYSTGSAGIPPTLLIPPADLDNFSSAVNVGALKAYVAANSGGGGGGSYDDTALSNRVSQVETGKVDKVAGKQLTDVNFTQDDKTKLDSLQNGSGGSGYDDTALSNRVTAVETGKVDKAAGKALSSNDYTNAEKAKLAGLKNYVEGTGISISADGTISATGGGSGSGYDDSALKSRVAAVEASVATKVEQVAGKQLTDVNFTPADKAKLDSLQNAASYDDTSLKNRVAAVETGKVDKVAGKQLTDVNFTPGDKAKLDSLTTYTAGSNITIANGVISSTATGGTSYDDTALKNRVTAVENGKLSNAPKSVSGAHIADDTISTNHFTDYCITETQMAPDAVGTSVIKDNSVTGAKLTSNSVSTAKLQDQAITAPKIANDAVQWYQLARWAVVEDKIKDDNVTWAKLSPEVRDRITAALAASSPRQLEFNYSPGSSVIEFTAGPNQVAAYVSSQYQNVSVVKIEQHTVNGLLVIHDGSPAAIPAMNIQADMRLRITVSQSNPGGFSFINLLS